jgi:hypothetical protein
VLCTSHYIGCFKDTQNTKEKFAMFFVFIGTGYMLGG